jgi:beta-aspartyl-dipeptidase (metallo-type)
LSARLYATWRETAEAVRDEGLDLETALATVTRNPARILRLAGKGSIDVGNDADLVLIDADFGISSMIARGTVFMEEGTLVKKGTFESDG